MLKDGRYLITAVQGMQPSRPPAAPIRSDALGGVRLQDVAAQVGLDFTQCAFRFRVTNEPDAMMGGGLCWIDYDDDGWLDLYVVNAYADDEYDLWAEKGGLPRSALFHNVEGRFEDVSRGSGADLQLRGNGCVAADFNRRAHGPVRDDRRLQRRHQRLRRAALGARRRHVHGGRPRGRDQRTRAGTPAPRSET